MSPIHSMKRRVHPRVPSAAPTLNEAATDSPNAESGRTELAPYEWPKLLDESKAPAFVHDADTRILRCNASYAARAAMPIEEIIGKPYWQILPKLSSPPPPCEVGHPLEGAEAPMFISDDGRIFAEHEVPVRCPEGNFWYCRHLLEDVTERSNLERELAREKEISDAIIESAPNAFVLIDQDGKLIRWNSYLRERVRLSDDELRGRPVLSLVHQEDRALLAARILTALTTGNARMEMRVDGDENGPGYFLTLLRKVMIAEDPYVVGFSVEITERKRAEKALEEQKVFLDALLENMPGVFCVLDSEGNYLRWNTNLNKLTGFSDDQLYKSSSLLTIFDEDRKEAAIRLKEVFEHGYAKAVLRVFTKERGIRSLLMTGRRFEVGGVPYAVGLGVDTTDQATAMAALEHEARTDGLTQIANRTHFMNRANDEFARSRRYGHTLSIWILDLDHFKCINDRYGHQAGDAVLKRFVDIGQEALRDWDFIGRLGGEEFGVLLPETDSQQALMAAERLRQSVAKTSIPVGSDEPISLTVSIGIATMRIDDNDVHALFSRADAALYEAKNSGRNKVCVAEQPMSKAISHDDS